MNNSLSYQYATEMEIPENMNTNTEQQPEKD